MADYSCEIVGVKGQNILTEEFRVANPATCLANATIPVSTGDYDAAQVRTKDQGGKIVPSATGTAVKAPDGTVVTNLLNGTQRQTRTSPAGP